MVIKYAAHYSSRMMITVMVRISWIALKKEKHYSDILNIKICYRCVNHYGIAEQGGGGSVGAWT
jgi:hypothetical protein